jgi:thiaminase (transcriptional activator TenA)
MAFTGELWKSIEPIYAAILRHPFLRGLTDGSLPR